jgi:hypothetical protein
VKHADPTPIRLSGRLISAISQPLADNELRDGVCFEAPPSPAGKCGGPLRHAHQVRSGALSVSPTRQGARP